MNDSFTPKRLWITLFCLWSGLAIGQNTVGLLSIDPGQAFPGYNLVYPHNQPTVHLLDNCGRIVHQWPDAPNFRPGNSAYLLPNGNLVKTKRENSSPVTDPIWAGGGGAIVEIRDWDNNLLHYFERNDSLYRLHHDIAPLPNGNVLMIAWEYQDLAASLAAGRDPDKMDQDAVWSEVIWEWDPVQDSIVWEWRVWDHLVQDFDPTKDNFGDVANAPGKIDLNYDTHDGHPDWLHINAIAYNPVLDHFALSVPYFDEIWVVDHGVSTEEARGPAGDLLYRFGNPAAYRQGSEADKMLFFQHDIHWTHPEAQPGDPAFGQMAVFNNRSNEHYSTAHTFSSLENGEYPFAEGRFGPDQFDRTFFHPDTLPITRSTGLSSFQLLPNGNALILSGRFGFAYELNPQGETVWEYRIPLRGGQPVSQGDSLRVNNNITFRMERYGEDYAGLQGKDLSTGDYWELNPNPQLCPLAVSTQDLLNVKPELDFFPNPSTGIIYFIEPIPERKPYRLYQLSGALMSEGELRQGQTRLQLPNLQAGMYVLQVGTQVRKLILH